MAEYDSPWKEALDRLFEPAMAFFKPEAHAEIDWTADDESLETEMRKLLPEAQAGPKRIDKLVKVTLKGTGDAAYHHFEVQCQPQEHFDKRMFDYNVTAYLKYDHHVSSTAILGDDDKDWRPGRYVFEQHGCKHTFEYPAPKLLDWRGRESELEGHANPFALFVLAHLQELATKDDEKRRAEWKLRLFRRVMEHPILEADKATLVRLIDWLLWLPRPRNDIVWQEFRKGQEGTKMAFLSYFEERELERKREGEVSGLLEGIETGLDLRFGAEGQALLPEVRKQTDPEPLRRFLRSIRTVKDLDELKQMLPGAPGTP